MTVKYILQMAMDTGWKGQYYGVIRQMKYADGYEDVINAALFNDPTLWEVLARILNWEPDIPSGLSAAEYQWHQYVAHVSRGGTLQSYCDRL